MISSEIESIGNYDVVIIGSGPAGITAAIAASNSGSKTLIVERMSFLGGLAASGLPLLAFHTLKRRQICKGLAEQIVDKLAEFGGTTRHVIGSADAHVGSMTPIYPEEYKILMDTLMKEQNVDVLLHASLVGVIAEDGHVKSSVLALKEGLRRVEAASFVDATGDADLVCFAGGEFVVGREKDKKVQSMTTLFNIASIDEEVVLKYFPKEIFYGKRPGDEHESLIHVCGGLGHWREVAGEDYPFKDDDHGLWGMILRPGQINLNIVDIIDKDGLTSKGLTEAEQEGRRQILKIYKFLKKYVPGFEHSFINFIHSTVGVRETRRIVGTYTLTKEDVIGCRKHSDVIARSAYSIDMHDPEGAGISFEMQKSLNDTYDIPMGTLIPKNLDNVVVAGRCLSAEHEALASCRVMVPCMLTGEAAGYAAALSVQEGVRIQDLSVSKVQEKLRATGAI